MIASPLTGVIFAFIIPIFFSTSSAPQDHFKDGLEWHGKGRLAEAIQAYGRAVELRPDFAEAYVKRGDAWLTIGDWSQAIWDYNEAITYEKQIVLKLATREYKDFKAAMARAHFGRAMIYEAQGYSLKATTEAARAVELGYDPVLVEAAIQRPEPLRQP